MAIILITRNSRLCHLFIEYPTCKRFSPCFDYRKLQIWRVAPDYREEGPEEENGPVAIYAYTHTCIWPPPLSVSPALSHRRCMHTRDVGNQFHPPTRTRKHASVLTCISPFFPSWHRILIPPDWTHAVWDLFVPARIYFTTYDRETRIIRQAYPAGEKETIERSRFVRRSSPLIHSLRLYLSVF